MEIPDGGLSLGNITKRQEGALAVICHLWHAATLESVDQVERALPLFARLFRRQPIWKELVPRLVTADLLPDDRALLQRILVAQ